MHSTEHTLYDCRHLESRVISRRKLRNEMDGQICLRSNCANIFVEGGVLCSPRIILTSVQLRCAAKAGGFPVGSMVIALASQKPWAMATNIGILDHGAGAWPLTYWKQRTIAIDSKVTMRVVLVGCVSM